jgi:hypothetical protein
MRSFFTACAAAALLITVAGPPAPVDAQTVRPHATASSYCYVVINYIAYAEIPWHNGNQGTGCYSVGPDGRIYQSTVSQSPTLTEIPGDGRADGIYDGYWESTATRRICVTEGGNVYYDNYVLGGAGWHGWTRSTNPGSDCPKPIT